MNHFSKIHQDLSEYLENPRVLTNPEEFLGPNYKKVLNFWMKLEELSEEQLEVVKRRYSEYNDNTSLEIKQHRISLIEEARKNVVGLEHTIEACAMAKAIVNTMAAWMATYELLCKEILEQQQQSLIFFPMFINL